MLKDPKELKKTLNGYAKFLVNQSKANLKQEKQIVSGALYNSIKQKVTTGVGSFDLSIFAKDYAKFIDQGVQGTGSGNKAPNSPYRFGSGTGKKGGLTDGIEKWIKRSGIKGRDKNTGRFITQKSLQHLIVRSIWFRGIAPSMFLTKALNQVMKYLPDDILKAYAIDLEGQIYNDIKNQEINLNG